MKKIKWEPENFELEMNTVWDFPERGSWATHDAKYRATGPPTFPEIFSFATPKKATGCSTSLPAAGRRLSKRSSFIGTASVSM